MPTDSTGRPIAVGDRVTFRGEPYTIKAFHLGEGMHKTARVEFVEPQHTSEPADEISVDLIPSAGEG